MKRFGLLAALVPLALAGCGKQGQSVGSPPPVVAAEPSGEDVPKDALAKQAPAAPPLAAGGEFKFPEDDAGKMLSKLLPPVPPPALAPLPPKGPSKRDLPAAIAQPRPAGLPDSVTLVRVPVPARLDPKPTALPERVPFDLAGVQPQRPEPIVLPVGGLTRLDAPDVKQPVALPILARTIPDRAPLEDPTTDFTAGSIINNNLPLRTTPAPFVKTNLPDPFENSEPAKVKLAPKDDPATALGNPPPPK